eukprot:1296298-Prymnesium_polylepis.2
MVCSVEGEGSRVQDPGRCGHSKLVVGSWDHGWTRRLDHATAGPRLADRDREVARCPRALNRSTSLHRALPTSHRHRRRDKSTWDHCA